MPEGTTYIAKRMEEAMKLITPRFYLKRWELIILVLLMGMILKKLLILYKLQKIWGKPVIVHARTIKGKGYKIAEGQHEHWHGVGPFNVEDGKFIKKTCSKICNSSFC